MKSKQEIVSEGIQLLLSETAEKGIKNQNLQTPQLAPETPGPKSTLVANQQKQGAEHRCPGNPLPVLPPTPSLKNVLHCQAMQHEQHAFGRNI